MCVEHEFWPIIINSCHLHHLQPLCITYQTFRRIFVIQLCYSYIEALIFLSCFLEYAGCNYLPFFFKRPMLLLSFKSLPTSTLDCILIWLFHCLSSLTAWSLVHTRWRLQSTLCCWIFCMVKMCLKNILLLHLWVILILHCHYLFNSIKVAQKVVSTMLYLPVFTTVVLCKVNVCQWSTVQMINTLL